MPKFFISKEYIQGDHIRIDGEEANHIGTVLRHKVGDCLTVCDGAQQDYYCEIQQITKKEVLLKIVDVQTCDTEPSIEITLFQGLPKGDKLEWIIQKCVELGVHSIVPVVTAYTVVKPDHFQKKLDRFQKIAVSAAKQSGRGRIPTIENVSSFSEICAQMNNFDAFYVCYEKADNTTLKAMLRGCRGNRVGIFIGPEGGFSTEEIQQLTQNSGQVISLGKRILRTETAGMMFLSILLYEMEDF